MTVKVGRRSLEQGLDVFTLEFLGARPASRTVPKRTAMKFHRTNGDVHDHAIGCLLPHRGLDVHEFLSAHVGAEAGFGDDKIGARQGQTVCDDRGVSVRNVRERSAVNEGGIAFQGLHQVGEEGVPKEQGHGSCSIEVVRTNRASIKVGSHDDLSQPLPEVRIIACKHENGHHFACGRDVKPVLSNESVRRSTQSNDDVAQGTVVEVDHTGPADPRGVEASFVSVLDVVVNERRKEVVRRGHGVQIAGEMQVDLLHWKHL